MCPRCKKLHYSAHYSANVRMNEFVNCECGYGVYSFADRGLQIVMPAQESDSKVKGISRKTLRMLEQIAMGADYSLEKRGGIDGGFKIAFWKDGHVDSGSTRSICDCLASRSHGETGGQRGA